MTGLGATVRASPPGSLIAAGVLASAALGIAMGFLGSSGQVILGLLLVTLVPVLAIMAVRAPEAAVGLIVFAQIFEWLEVQSPLGTISPSIIALMIFLIVRLPDVVPTMWARGYGLPVASFGVFVAAHALQFLHADAAQAARQLITAASFAAYGLLGMYIGSRRAHLVAAAVGAGAVLLVSGTLALASNAGVTIVASTLSPPREILGIMSPFLRSYGVPGVLVALLLPLCIPALVLYASSSGSPAVMRAGALTAVALIGLASLFLFQSRSMVLEIAIAVMLVVGLTGRRFGVGMLVIGLCLGVAVVIGLTLTGSTDPIGNQFREESYSTAITFFAGDPQRALLGTDPSAFRVMVNAATTYGHLIPADAPIHNLLIETIVVGGVAGALALLVLAFSAPARALRMASRVGRFSGTMTVMLAAAIMAILEVAVTPAVANSAGFWMTMGWCAAVGASVAHAPASMPPPEGVLPSSRQAIQPVEPSRW